MMRQNYHRRVGWQLGVGPSAPGAPNTYKTEPAVVDLKETTFPESVEVHVGSFCHEGVYHLIRGSRAPLPRIVYGDYELLPKYLRPHACDSFYVETFARGEELVIKIIGFFDEEHRRSEYVIKTLQIEEGRPVPCDRKLVGRITNGVVFLDLNITPGAPLHPFVERQKLLNETQVGYQYNLACKHRGYTVNRKRSHRKNKYRFGPVIYTIQDPETDQLSTSAIFTAGHTVRTEFRSKALLVFVERLDSQRIYIISQYPNED